MDKEIDSMLACGVIEPSTAAYASPIVVVKKPDGSNRICVDYRKLNKITVFDPEPMPQMRDIFAELCGSQYYSKFDFVRVTGRSLCLRKTWTSQRSSHTGDCSF